MLENAGEVSGIGRESWEDFDKSASAVAVEEEEVEEEDWEVAAEPVTGDLFAGSLGEELLVLVDRDGDPEVVLLIAVDDGVFTRIFSSGDVLTRPLLLLLLLLLLLVLVLFPPAPPLLAVPFVSGGVNLVELLSLSPLFSLLLLLALLSAGDGLLVLR